MEELLNQLNSCGEDSRIEAKTGRQIGPSILETVSAFANEPGLDGGWLLLGVSNQENNTLFPVYEPIGLTNPEKIQEDLVSQCSTMFNRPLRPEVWIEIINGTPVIGVYVAERPFGEKPLHLKKLGLPGGAYRRIGTSDVKCNSDDLLIFHNDNQGQSFDSTILSDALMTDIDPDLLHEYRILRARVNPNAPELSYSDEDLLFSLICAKRQGDQLQPTVAGIVLFGSAMALRRLFPMMRVDYIRVQGKEWVADPDRRFNTTEIRAPLLRAIPRIAAAVLDDIPKAFSLPAGSIEKTETPLVPERVIREAVVNALMHGSYRLNTPIQIIRYSNRLEIRNAGHSLKAEDRLGEPGSQHRNPFIAAVLNETPFAETKGSGIGAMRSLMKSAGLALPTFQSDRENDNFTATFLFTHLLGPDSVEWLGKFRADHLTDDQARALVFVREAGGISNAQYRDISQVDASAARQHLKKLCALDLLEQQGHGSATVYIPTAKFHADSRSFVSEPGRFSDEPGRLEVEPARSSDEPDRLEPEPIRLQSEAESLVGGKKPEIKFELLPPHLQAALKAFRKTRNLEKTRRMIKDLCAWQAMKARDLAVLLNRNRSALLQEHLKPMIITKELEYVFPENLAHPQQAYQVPRYTRESTDSVKGE